jgi:hypothetical protein
MTTKELRRRGWKYDEGYEMWFHPDYDVGMLTDSAEAIEHYVDTQLYKFRVWISNDRAWELEDPEDELCKRDIDRFHHHKEKNFSD